MAVVVDRRARRKLETYRALSLSARELVVLHGFDGVTVEQIADAAGVSARTFFNYFSSKEEAVLGVEPGMLEALAAEVIGRPRREHPAQALMAVLVGDADELPSVARRFVLREELVAQYPVLQARSLAALAHTEQALIGAVAVRLGVDPTHDPYPTVVVSAVLAVFRSTIAWWHRHGETVPLAEVVRAGMRSLDGGLNRAGGRSRRS
jgi:AcrR family transcriptional regulator